MSDLDKIKERIRALLATAENDASTDGEVNNAMRFADALMRRHNLQRSDVEACDDGTFDINKVSYDRRSVTLVGQRRTSWEMSLARLITQFVGTCKWYYNSNAYRREPNGNCIDSDLHGKLIGATVTFYGPEEDVRLCCELFRDMGLQIAHNGKVKFGGYARGDGAAYCEGFVSGLREVNRRVERDQLEDKTSSPGERALILANRQLTTQLKQRAVSWLRDDVGLELVSGQGLGGSQTGSSAARGEGVRDGRATKMSRNRATRIG